MRTLSAAKHARLFPHFGARRRLGATTHSCGPSTATHNGRPSTTAGSTPDLDEPKIGHLRNTIKGFNLDVTQNNNPNRDWQSPSSVRTSSDMEYSHPFESPKANMVPVGKAPSPITPGRLTPLRYINECGKGPSEPNIAYDPMLSFDMEEYINLSRDIHPIPLVIYDDWIEAPFHGDAPPHSNEAPLHPTIASLHSKEDKNQPIITPLGPTIAPVQGTCWRNPPVVYKKRHLAKA